MEEEIKKILGNGIKAPSGANSQPWRFKISGNKVTIFADYEKDHPVLNYRNRGTLVAHGALLENIFIAAQSLGYKVNVNLFPEGENSKHLADLEFEPAAKQTHPLFQWIDKRATNRKPYDKQPLDQNQIVELSANASDFPDLKVKFETDPGKLKILGEASSMNEVVMLENEKLHNLFFNEITWDTQEDEKRRAGFYLETLELAPPQKFAFKKFRSWPVMNFFNRFGVAKGIAHTNAGVYSSVGAIGVIIVRDYDKDFLEAGKLMESIFLKATSMGLSTHLVTGILYLWQRIKDGDSSGISETHQKIIRGAYQKIAQVFGVDDQHLIAVLFRIGKASEPSAYSKRISLEQLLEK